MADQLYIREATLEDYDNVMKIGEVYFGRDYLPALYSKYLKSYKCYVGVIDGEIIAFSGGRLVDNGETLTTAASRVKDTFQGKGILASLLKHIIEHFKDTPSLTREAMTSNNLTTARNGGRILKKYSKILDKPSTEYISTPEDLKDDVARELCSDLVQEIDEKELYDLFHASECSDLFPDSRIVASWHPFRLYIENIPLILENRRMYGTKQGGIYTQISVCDEFYSVQSRFFRYRLDLYGNDQEALRKHLAKHILNIKQQMLEKEAENIAIYIIPFTDKYLDPNFITDILKSFGFIESAFEVNRLFLLEKEINLN